MSAPVVPYRCLRTVLGALYLVCAQLVGLRAHAQDAVINGDYVDAVTGDTIRNGSVQLVGVNGYDVKAMHLVSIYSGLEVDLNFGYDALLYFNAPGYTTRVASVQFSGRRSATDPGNVFTFDMTVPMTPLQDTARLDTNMRRMGKCLLKGGKEVVWVAEDPGVRCSVSRVPSRSSRLRAQVKARIPRSWRVAVYGRIRDHWTERIVAGAEVVAKGSDGTEVIWPLGTDSAYAGELHFDRTYQLVYRAPGYVSKIVLIDTEAIPDKERLGGFGINVEMRLFQEIPGEDVSFLSEPIGRAAFSHETRKMEFDMAYSQPRLQRLKAILDRNRR